MELHIGTLNQALEYRIDNFRDFLYQLNMYSPQHINTQRRKRNNPSSFTLYNKTPISIKRPKQMMIVTKIFLDPNALPHILIEGVRRPVH